MSPIFYAVIAISICTICRFTLNIQDRVIFFQKRQQVSFHLNILLCCLIPFIFACSFQVLRNSSFSLAYFLNSIQTPWAFWNGLALFSTGTAFCYGFSKMQVKSVVILAKITDIFTPFVFFVSIGFWDLKGTLFNIFLLSAFSPIMIRSIQKSKIHWTSLSLIIISLVVQVVIVQLLFKKTASIDSFMADFLCTSFWRACIGLLFFFVVGFIHYNGHSLKANYKQQIIRGLPAFIAQSSHLYAGTISAKIAIYSWPIANSAPIIASILAHKILKEEMDSFESISIALFIGVVCLWIFSSYII